MRAVALSSGRKNNDTNLDAPMVVAKGYGVTAEAIVQRAREHGLYVHESADLVNLLMHVNLDQQIPPQMYLVVAELLAWLYEIEESQIHLHKIKDKQ
ncbi:flagellar protein FhlB [Glaciimonas sp. GS1]|uniref:Flagellar protein FhlB n=2 Tax=Glaciimonas soli TaxID=2590999 RepID=A0A843YNS7_9BURK|nr:EscU/YscU/HrcU family type III secretion system export apparatus switch protein [Glaciimonas soli]MQQ99433.1 flagellar protein FhlB [Glaciimonas soli]